MLNHVARKLPLFEELYPSDLDRAVARKVRWLPKAGAPAEKAGEHDAAHSQATEGYIRAFFDAWEAGDEYAGREALNKVVHQWRADNAAGGVPVHGHLPLPGDFAQSFARLANEASTTMKPAFAALTASLDPGVKRSVALQLADLVNESSDELRQREFGNAGDERLSEVMLGRGVESLEAGWGQQGGRRLSVRAIADRGRGLLPQSAHVLRGNFLEEAYAQTAAYHDGIRDRTRAEMFDEDAGGSRVADSRRSSNRFSDDRAAQFSASNGGPDIRLLPKTRKGQICHFGRCHEARDSLEIDGKIPQVIKRFEEKVMRGRLGPFQTLDEMKRDPSFHQYYHTTRISVPPHQRRHVLRMMQILAGPQQDYTRPIRSEPVRDGDTSPVTALGIPAGFVTHYVDPVTGAVANVTMPGKHMLDPGYVVRWLEALPDGTFVLHTLGRGVGYAGDQNEIMGAQVFAYMDQAIAHKLGGRVLMP
jgi:hypothetical protein